MDNFTIEDIKEKLCNNFDIKYREIKCSKGIIYIVYVENLCDLNFISQYIVAPIMDKAELCVDIEALKKEVIVANTADDVESLDNAIDLILTGYAIIIPSFLKTAISCSAIGFKRRSIDIPITETVIKGPREGFVEAIQDNISSIRRRIKTPNLKIESILLGKQSKTVAAMIYIHGITPEKLIGYVREKIHNVEKQNNKDFVLYSNYIEEILKCKGTPFDTIGFTEKPDIAASKLAEGRILILVDGSPFVITAPYFFIENFQSPDDYTTNKFMANTGRIMRAAAFVLSTLIPGLYLALITYHFRLVPSVFLIRIAIYRAGVPMPTVVELIYMIFFFQLIREAGVRLPQPIGPTLSIVGALILGDAAVQSGLTSQVTVVVVAITSIASYLIPKIYIGVFLWSIIMILFSGISGLPGFYMGFIVFVSHLSSLTTCGYPYLYPFGTLSTFKYKDILFRGDLNSISSNILNGDEKK